MIRLVVAPDGCRHTGRCHDIAKFLNFRYGNTLIEVAVVAHPRHADLWSDGDEFREPKACRLQASAVIGHTAIDAFTGTGNKGD